MKLDDLGDDIISEKDEVATTGKTTRILKQFRARYPEAQNDIEALLLHFDAGQHVDRTDINRLDTENDTEETEIDQLRAEVEDLKDKVDNMNPTRDLGEAAEDSAMSQLSNIGRALMHHASKIKDEELSNTLAIVGDSLTRYGAPNGPRTISALEKDTGLPRSTILKVMEFGTKLADAPRPADQAVGESAATISDSDKRIIKMIKDAERRQTSPAEGNQIRAAIRKLNAKYGVGKWDKVEETVNEADFDMLDHQKRYFVRRLKQSRISPEKQIQIMARVSQIDDLNKIEALHDKLDAMGVSDLGESALREACRMHKKK